PRADESYLFIGNAGGSDAFVTELGPSGNGLVYSTYLGGSSNDTGQALALDAVDNAFVTGSTSSVTFPSAAPFPNERLQGANGGGADAFVAMAPFLNPVSYTESGTGVLTLRRSGTDLQLLRDGQLVWAKPVAGISSLTIQGPNLYVDNSFGGVFAIRDGIQFNGGTLYLLGTPGGDGFSFGGHVFNAPVFGESVVGIDNVETIYYTDSLNIAVGSAIDSAGAGDFFVLQGVGFVSSGFVGTPTYSIFRSAS